MSLTGRLSIRSKLVMLLLLTSIVCILVVAYQGYRSGKTALREAMVNELTTLRTAKTQQVKMALTQARDQFLAFAENRTIIDALSEFRTAFQLASRETVPEASRHELAGYYQKEFIPRLKERMGGVPEVKHYLPDASAATYLQYHYLAANPYEVGKKDELIRAEGDATYYAQVHERYHESLRSLLKTFGFYDLFLIDHETGDIIYTVFKETDFGTNLRDGPYASSNLAALVEQVMRTKERGKVEFQDFDVYFPSYGAPASFAAVTVYDGKEIVGILALQHSTEGLNQIMTSSRKWEESGMGETGEVYLVGRDQLMRSDSRFLIQHRERYLKRLHGIGMPDDEIERIDKNNTTILFQLVHSETVDLALNGKTGVKEVPDYRRVPVLSAYAPLRAYGLDWVILAEMDIAEINIPIDRFRRQVMVSASILGVIITLLALVAANYFTRPINALVSALRRVAAGETDVNVEVSNKDELGELARSFNSMVDGIQQQKKLIEKKDQENELLLRNILPDAIVKRMKAGEEHIVDRIPNVSVVFTLLTGLSQHNDQESPKEAIKKLGQLITRFDEAGNDHDVDKIETVGGNYMAACGLITPRLDHNQRALAFALEMMDMVRQINRQEDLDLRLRIGIHSGSVLAGVVGHNQFDYDVWGTTVDIVSELRYAAAQGSICISEQTYQLMQDKTGFEQGEPVNVDGQAVPTWHLAVQSKEEARRA